MRDSRQSKGVPASPSGHSRAEPEEVSVVPTSVPNAVPEPEYCSFCDREDGQSHTENCPARELEGDYVEPLEQFAVAPSRDDNGCPYELTDVRAIDQALAWHEGYRAALRWMMETGR